MPRPGVEVLNVEQPPPRSIPLDTGTGFFAREAERGPHAEAVLITSLARFRRRYGERVSYSPLYDTLEAFFTEGGARAYIGRVVGPTPVRATLDLMNATPVATVKVEAVDVGEYGNNYEVAVVAGDVAGFQVVITDTLDDDAEVERSSDLADTTELVEWAENSDYIRVTELAGTGNPVVAAAAALVGGTDDRTNITNTERQEALDLFEKNRGPGQVCAPGITTETCHQQLLDHCAALDGLRVAVCAGPNTTSAATLKTAAANFADYVNSRHGGMWGNWPVIRGFIPSTTRTIPPEGVVLGLIARSDRRNTPNVPAAGINGRTVTVIDLSYQPLDFDAEELNEAGVNLFRKVYGVFENYGYRTLATKDDNPNWWKFSNVRLYMGIVARGTAVAENYVFAEIDGQRKKLAALEGDIAGVCLAYYNAGSLFGATAEEAFRVDATSLEANPVDQLADGVVRVFVFVKMSPFAELVRLEISKIYETDPIPA